MSDSIIYVGMDVHKDSITMAILPDGADGDAARVERIPNELSRLRRLLARLARAGRIRACYEASGAGYVLQRTLTVWGYDCEVIAPGLIPTRPAERRKHDKHDAIQLARLYRAGELTVIRIPSESEERVRDLVRCRETLHRELVRSRHYVVKFLARRGYVYRAGTNWTQPYWRWLRQLQGSGELAAEDRTVLGEYLALVEYTSQRRDELDRQIEALALTPAYEATVARLRCFRGIETHAAMVLASELGDWRRFGSPRELMAYLGLVPSEHSSGPHERRGAITKAGNSRCRHVLLQAAWAYRYQPRLSVALRARQRGQPAATVAHAWKAQHRLHKVYSRLTYRKRAPVAVVAVARELVGFLWAVLQDVEPATAATPLAAVA